MRLKSLKIKNFRGYREEVEVYLNNITCFIGENDAGKSTLLEALAIFFNNPTVKIEKNDLNVDAVENGEDKVEITCIFNGLPAELIIDAASPTTLKQEYLLNEDECLEVKKVYGCGAASPKEKIFIVAHHPTVQNGQDLLLLKRAQLKERANALNIPVANYNGSVNSSIRKVIWESLGDLQLSKTEIQIDQEDSKKAWEYLEKWMPQFALFKSDRESNDGDKEITDPMKIAVQSAIDELSEQLEVIQESVKQKTIEVATRTLEKLQEMNPALASELTPDFKSDPKWANLFSLTLSSDRNIPINKRGSGVRRLIILNFFRAEAERRREIKNSKAIIYAFEEPENSQHPDHQKMLMHSFQELSETDNTQVLITTHNPALAGLVNEDNIRFVAKNDDGNVSVLEPSEDLMRVIAKTLGMLPEPLKPKLLFCVEGPNDVIFFKNISRLINQNMNKIPNLFDDTRVAIFPLGGSALKDWVTVDYLKGLEITQYHIYDLDDPLNPPYETYKEAVRSRGGQNWANLTTKRETENYLHPDCIQATFGFAVTFTDMDDLPEIIARTQHENSGSPHTWVDLDDEKRKSKASRVKKRLNSEVSGAMSWEQLQEADPNGDIISWFQEIADRLS